MSNDASQNVLWSLCVINYGESEYHRLAVADLREVLQEECRRPFNGLLIDRDVTGRLGLFCRDDKAFCAWSIGC